MIKGLRRWRRKEREMIQRIVNKKPYLLFGVFDKLCIFILVFVAMALIGCVLFDIAIKLGG
jgi:hypothetical protein